jgi:hypothetical protein
MDFNIPLIPFAAFGCASPIGALVWISRTFLHQYHLKTGKPTCACIGRTRLRWEEIPRERTLLRRVAQGGTPKRGFMPIFYVGIAAADGDRGDAR